jgi:hypothetical protein
LPIIRNVARRSHSVCSPPNPVTALRYSSIASGNISR